MNKQEAIRLISQLINISILNYEIATNIKCVANDTKYYVRQKELAKKLLQSLTNEPFSESDIEQTLNW